MSWVKESGLDSMEEVDGAVMSLIALIGVVVDVALALVLGVENHVHMPGDDHGHDHGHSHAHEDCGGHDEYEGQDGMWQYHGHSHDHDHGHHDDEDPEEGDGCSNDDPDFDPLLPPQGGCDIQKGGGEVPKSKKNINLHAAYVHVLGDLAQSVAVLVAGLVIWWRPSWRVIDPILSVIFCPIIFYSTIGVIRSSLNILLEGVPSHINLDAVQSSIASVDGVSHVCDLHVWSISHVLLLDLVLVIPVLLPNSEHVNQIYRLNLIFAKESAKNTSFKTNGVHFLIQTSRTCRFEVCIMELIWAQCC